MQIIRGLEILDRNELVHFDIKPENLLIQQVLYIKKQILVFKESSRIRKGI